MYIEPNLEIIPSLEGLEERIKKATEAIEKHKKMKNLLNSVIDSEKFKKILRENLIKFIKKEKNV